jgi:hypothetical protein
LNTLQDVHNTLVHDKKKFENSVAEEVQIANGLGFQLITFNAMDHENIANFMVGFSHDIADQARLGITLAKQLPEHEMPADWFAGSKEGKIDFSKENFEPICKDLLFGSYVTQMSEEFATIATNSSNLISKIDAKVHGWGRQ